ncbi:MAG: putative phytoene synthase [Frankiales bacterium]|nr:putative phytoene synthase [Frankiales bacterium]
MTAAQPLSTALLAGLDEKARSENFPVALRVLPRAVRADLSALYRYARLVDDIGDLAAGDRLALLDAVERDIRTLHATGHASLAVLLPLAGVIRRHSLPVGPFVDLIQANRQDQRVRRYDTWPDLAVYCSLSAEPVGRLVLGVFGAADPARLADSDAVCTGLQLVEHLQDLGEDLRDRDRVYLPAETMAAHGVSEHDLRAASASPALRAAVAAECDRARSLLLHGRPLIASLHGWARVAVAGYVAGGLAAIEAIEAAGHDTLSALRRAPKRRVLVTAVRVWRSA